MSLASELIQRVKLGSQGVAQQIGSAQDFVRKHPVTSAVSVGGGLLATGGIIQIIRKARKKSSKPKKLSRKKSVKRTKKSKVYRRGGKRQRQPYTAGKGKDTSTRRIRFTKNNQPYVILRSGKARFIKKSAVKRMRKLKGGKY